MKQTEIVAQLKTLGVRPGSVLIVHSSFRNIRPPEGIEGGVEGLIAALRTALGEQGTLVMPSMSSLDDQIFSPTTTPCDDLGAVADTFWRLPGVLRSDSHHAFAAIGPHAAEITAPHPAEIPHGLDSPPGRVYALGGQVLLLGIGHDSNTTIHVAENIAEVPYGLDYHVLELQDGKPVRVDYREVDHCGERFELVDEWLAEKGLQRKGTVGVGEAILCNSRDVVQTVLAHLQEDKLAFLHPAGTDEECDKARASIPSS